MHGRAAVRAGAEASGVSVVTPCLNAAETLDRALASLVAQTYATWDAVVVDDGSQDDSARIAERWAARDARIRVLRQGHAGTAAARNHGLALARRAWVCFLDADDWLAPTAFERWLKAAQRSPEAAVLVGRSVRVTQDGRLWSWPRRDLSDPFGVLCSECAIPIHSALVRRSILEAVGSFDAGLRTSEDWDLWQRIARAGCVFAQTDELVAYYQTRPGSLSRNVDQATADALEVMQRGHAPDPRVPDAPSAYAQGAPADALVARQLYYVLWSAARRIATGGDGLSIAAMLPRPLPVDFEPDSIGELMAAGVADMLALRAEEAGRDWPTMEPRFRRLLATVYPEPARRRLNALALAAIKAALNGGRPGAPDVLQLDEAQRAPAMDETADFAVLQLRQGERTLGTAAIPLLGRRNGASLAAAVAAQAPALPLRSALLAARPWRSPAFGTAVVGAFADPRGLALRAQARNPSRLAAILGQRLRHALGAGLQATVAARLAPRARDGGPCEHDAELARLREEAAAIPAPASAAQPTGPRQGEARWPGEQAGPGAWDQFFDAEDPWERTSAYERLKFADTLELVPELPDGVALELACAEGHFSERLAGKVGRLLATDISVKALERARARCAGLANVSFQPLDFARQPIPDARDLIVCSEALYYVGEQLPEVAKNIAASLKPGGWLVMAHSSMIADEPEATGFDWGHRHGSRSIGEVFRSLPGLSLEREIRRPLYRVQAFRRTGPGAAPEPQVEVRPLDVALEPSVARNVVWGGGISRLACFHAETAVSVPVLMYHRVSPQPIAGLERYCVDPERFEHQIAWLRRNGYWGVTPDDLLRALSRNIPLPGRPVMLTFDDGYADFAEHAWPALQRHDFRATVFVVADAVGGRSDWDAAHGPPAPLMDWPTLADLAAAGVTVESHGASHRPLTQLGVREAYREVLRAAALIETATGRAPTAFCYPYGAHDRVAEGVVRECGAQLGFTTDSRVATLTSSPMRLPRVEVSGFDDLQSFARKLGRAWTGSA